MEQLYRIQTPEGRIFTGTWTLERAMELARWEDEACTFIALSEQKQSTELERNLRFALGDWRRVAPEEEMP